MTSNPRIKTALVACSLAVNATLVGLLAWRPDIVPKGLRFLPHAEAGAPARASASAALPRPPRARLWARLHHNDPVVFVARLRAAGFSAAAIRALVTNEINARYDARLRNLEDPDPATPFWLMKPPYYAFGDERMEAVNQLRRERARAMRDLFTDDFFATDDVTGEQRRQFGDLSRSKIDALQRIEDDYAEMYSAVKAAAGGIMLPHDREKLDYLAREKAADLARVLTPEELADYSVRSSPVTRMLRSRWGEFDATDAEFRVVFAAQTNLNQRLGSNTFSSIDQATRDKAQAAYLWEINSGLGPARYADFVWQTSAEYQQLSRIAERNNLPAGTPAQILLIREAVARESTRIYDDQGTNLEAKRSALAQLAALARTQFTMALGPTAGASYIKVADRWLSYIERGAAVAFTRPDTVTIATEHGTHSYTGLPDIRWLPQPR